MENKSTEAMLTTQRQSEKGKIKSRKRNLILKESDK